MCCVLSFMYECERVCMCVCMCDDRANNLLIYVTTMDSLHSPIVV